MNKNYSLWRISLSFTAAVLFTFGHVSSGAADEHGHDGFKSIDGEVTMRAQNEAVLEGDEAVRMQKLLDALEDLDDVQDVYTSAVIELD